MRGGLLMVRITCVVLAAFCAVGTVAAQVRVVENGKARAVVVTADKPSLTAAYAAKELVTHIEKATGKRLKLVGESDIPKGYASRIFVGVTQAALKQGIKPDKLGNDEFVLRTIGSDLFVLGKEDFFGSPPPDRHSRDIRSRRKRARVHPLSVFNQYSGTLFGVYEILERHVGVRWLWPGELGTYVPRTQTVEIGALDKKIGPRVLYRMDPISGQYRRRYLHGVELGRPFKPIPHSYPMSEQVLRSFVFPTVEAGRKYGRAAGVYVRRHRIGCSYLAPRVPRTNHHPGGIRWWWLRFGKSKPEWFAMRSDGTRGPKKGENPAQVPLCVSNPELHRFIVYEAWDGGDVLRLGEADAAGDSFCQCPKCLAWDGPQPKRVPELVRHKYTPRLVSDRYARYWKTIYDMAVRVNPNVRLVVYLYHNTFPAPLTDIKLNKNIVGEFVLYGGEDGWYPMSEEEDRWTREQWLGWSKTGVSLLYRPNYWHGNYVVPSVTTWQVGEFLRFAYSHGMIGATFSDGMVYHWAVHGPMAYLHYRLLWNPELEVKDVRKEYFSGFGPASALVEQYFDYWEKYARSRLGIADEKMRKRFGRFLYAVLKLRRPLGGYVLYPPKVYPPAEAILKKALAAARKHPLPEFADRVKFLQAGLKHAQLSTRICGLLQYDLPGTTTPRPPADPEKRKQAMQAIQELSEFRRAPENLFVADYISATKMEQWTHPRLRPLLRAAKALSNPLPAPPANWTFRHDPGNRGVKEGWHRADVKGGAWEPIEVPAFWPKTKKGDFLLGYGWCRATFSVPKEWRGKPLHLLFGAVDEQAWVYVNGQPVGEHTVKSTRLDLNRLWNKPFSIEVNPECIEYGETNLLTVRVHNSAFNGGIWRPVIGGVLTPEEKAGLDKIDQFF